MSSKIVCDKCGSDQIVHSLVNTDPQVTMSEYVAQRKSGLTTLVYRPQHMKIECTECGHSIEYTTGSSSAITVTYDSKAVSA